MSPHGSYNKKHQHVSQTRTCRWHASRRPGHAARGARNDKLSDASIAVVLVSCKQARLRSSSAGSWTAAVDRPKPHAPCLCPCWPHSARATWRHGQFRVATLTANMPQELTSRATEQRSTSAADRICASAWHGVRCAVGPQARPKCNRQKCHSPLQLINMTNPAVRHSSYELKGQIAHVACSIL